MKRKVGYFVGSGITLIWILFFYQYMLFQQRSQLEDDGFIISSNEASPKLNQLASPKVAHQLAVLRKNVDTLTSDNDRLQHYVQRIQNVIGDGRLSSNLTVLPSAVPVIAVVVFACNRPTIRRHLDQLIKYRPSAASFPIYVSQDCGHEETAGVIASYGDQVTHMKHSNNTAIVLNKKDKKFAGYYKIARHYKWGLNQVFDKYNHTALIITEDDLDISPDFFEYFAGTYPLLVVDKTLWCVSAWNDNGKAGSIANAPELLYRTDFFPGLGWMLRRQLWTELQSKWPQSFWDDWMRRPEQRLNRSCIRPEVSRTSTFGKKGVSNGQFFEQHLKFIKLNDVMVRFTRQSMSYLLKDVYDARFTSDVYAAKAVSIDDLRADGLKSEGNPLRLEYKNKADFIKYAKMLGVMPDFKAGVPRTGYRGVVTFVYKGHRVFLAPVAGWTAYDLTWN